MINLLKSTVKQKNKIYIPKDLSEKAFAFSDFLLLVQIYNQNRLFLSMRRERLVFSKDERLKSRKLINDLFDSGKIIHHHPFKVLYQITKNENDNFPAKIAISVSKKNFKRAVDRNIIKRKIKETYRQNKQLLYDELDKIDQKLYFFVIYTARHDLDYFTLDIEMKHLIQKINDKLNQF